MSTSASYDQALEVRETRAVSGDKMQRAVIWYFLPAFSFDRKARGGEEITPEAVSNPSLFDILD